MVGKGGKFKDTACQGTLAVASPVADKCINTEARWKTRSLFDALSRYLSTLWLADTKGYM